MSKPLTSDALQSRERESAGSFSDRPADSPPRLRTILLASVLVLVPNLHAQGQNDDNPNYLNRNPFFFEGKVDYELLKIDQPSTAWEFMQRGIHRQDDLEDYPAAIDDYRASIERNNLQNESCQIVTTADVAGLDPAPCMFTVRLRLGYLLLHDDPAESIRLFNEVLEIDPQRLEVNLLIAEAYEVEAEEAADSAAKLKAYEEALKALDAELALSPVLNDPSLSPDKANNAHVHWLKAEIYEAIGRLPQAVDSLNLYIEATRWHSDVLPWRIPLARKKIAAYQQQMTESSRRPLGARRR